MALQLIILHSNDIHGRVEGIARIASLVERTRTENPGVPVVYLDAGDVEEPCPDWKFEPYGGYVDPAWGLVARYDLPTILREALEEHLAIHWRVDVQQGRLGA